MIKITCCCGRTNQTFYHLDRTHESECMFPDSNGNPVSYYSVQNHFKRDQKRAGVRRIKFHALRNTFASHFVAKGESIYDLKELLGHASVSTTMRYASLASSHLVKKANVVTYQAPDSCEPVSLESKPDCLSTVLFSKNEQDKISF